MKTIFVLFASGALGLAQGPAMQSLLPQYEAVKLNFVEAAEVMPEADYGYKLTPAQRAYGEWIGHTAGMNLRMCSQVKGETAPAADLGDKSKAALVKALKASFAYCDSVLAATTDEAALKVPGPGKVVPLGVMISQVAQLNSHYGNMVGYLRTKGIVPPSTARAQKK
jgi:hypothetical protein